MAKKKTTRSAKRPAKKTSGRERQQTIPGIPKPTKKLINLSDKLEAKSAEFQRISTEIQDLKKELLVLMKQQKLDTFETSSGRPVEIDRKEASEKVKLGAAKGKDE